MRKRVRNDSTKYLTRAKIGGETFSRQPKFRRVSESRRDFVLDEAGYFKWDKDDPKGR